MTAISGESVEQDMKREITFVVWNEFNRIIVEEKLMAKCVWCQDMFSASPNNGTSHLHAHLATCANRQANSKFPSSIIIYIL